MTQSELKSKLEKSVEFLKGELSKLRTGRASPTMIESVMVNAYGTKMAVREVGSISVADPQNLVVSPWDKNLADEVAKAIRESDLNLNPSVDGAVVRVPVPALTEERRKEMAKQVSTKIEDVKNSIRNIRQEAMKDIDDEFDSKSIGEDEKFSKKEDVEELVKEYTDKAIEMGEDKKSDILSI